MLLVEIAIGLLLLVWVATRLQRPNLQILATAGMLLVAGLILAVIVVSPRPKSVHPDEASHMAAYDYYVNHWAPPAISNPATIPSTSIWGFSYLFELDVVYDVAAHVMEPIRTFTNIGNWLSARLFQYALWVTLCAMAIWKRSWAGTLCVVLLTPQVWYVFSYFNGDALPLTLSLVTVCVIKDNSSGLQVFLRDGSMRHASLWVAVVCMGLLIVSKSNYLPVVPILFLWLAIIHLNLRAPVVLAAVVGMLIAGVGVMFGGALGGAPYSEVWHLQLEVLGGVILLGVAAYACLRYWRTVETRRVLLRLIGVAALCIAIAAPRIAWDVHVNGWPAQKSATIHNVEEQRAGHDFKPSTIARDQGYPTAGLASRGVSLSAVIFAPYHWASTSLTSSFGVYGFMNIFGPKLLYELMYSAVALFVLLNIYLTRKTHSDHWPALFLLVLGGTFLILTSSALLSWIGALQAQGRYLLGIVPMIALLVTPPANTLSRAAFVVLVAFGLALSVYSFAFVGLPEFT